MSRCAAKPPLHCGGDPIADCNPDVLHYTVIPITIDHAGRAAVVDPFGSVEFGYVAHRPIPVMAAIEIEMPIKIEELVPAKTAEQLRFAAQMPLHVFQ